MSKIKQKNIAYNFYTSQYMTAKAIAAIVGVTEKTVGNWIKKGSWQEIRSANINSPAVRIDNIKAIINRLTEQQLQVFDEIKKAEIAGDKKQVTDFRKQSAGISQEIAIHNKSLEKMDKDNKIPLNIYMEVMCDIFEALQKKDTQLHLLTVDFQQEHLQTVSLKLG